MTERNILINGLRVHYKIAGEGPAVLILHGWGGSSDSWLEVQRILADKGYKVICPDLPGFGQSITPPRPWNVKDYSNFVLNFTKQLGIEDFFLLGHSFGGRISIRFSIDHSEKIKKLIFCDSTGIKPKPGFKTRVIFGLAKIGNALFTPKILRRFKDAARNIFYLFLRHKDYVKANGTMKETIKRVLEEDLLTDLPKIKTKTLIVWGGADRMVPVKYAHIFNQEIKDSQLEILPKIGHSPHLEVPEVLSQKIKEFIE